MTRFIGTLVMQLEVRVRAGRAADDADATDELGVFIQRLRRGLGRRLGGRLSAISSKANSFCRLSDVLESPMTAGFSRLTC